MSGDLHCHTKLSDGSLGIEDLIILAKKSKIDTIAITDHDCLAGTVRGKIIGERNGIRVIPGVELSAYDYKRGRKVHLLCYLSDCPDRLEGLCRRTSLSRKKASQYMVLKAASRYPISAEYVMKCASGSTNIFKQHIMHALVDAGYSSTIFSDLFFELFSAKSPNNILVEPKYPDVFDVMTEIHNSGGIAVLAHPATYDSFDLIDELVECGLDGVEVWHPRNSETDTARLQKIAKEKGLLMTGGTDFHGMYSRKPMPLGTFSTPQENIEELLSYKAKQKRQQKKTAEVK